MRAAVLYESRAPMTIEDVTLEGPKDDEVLVQVRVTGACHSDYHVINGSWNGPGYPLPMILGHEAAGVVEQVGADVHGLKSGDHVILSFAPKESAAVVVKATGTSLVNPLSAQPCRAQRK